MNVPTPEQTGAATRTVSAHEENGRTRFAIVATRDYTTTSDDLWNALTDPARLVQWFLPVSGELREGGNYQFEGNAGGEIRECSPPERLVVTWGMGEDTSLLTLSLSELEAGRTRLALEHTGDVAGEFWEQYGPGSVGIGWDMAFFGLAEHFLPEPSVTSTNAEEWMTSEDGKRFGLRSGEAWRDAAVAGGTSPEAADRAHAAVVAFYAGEAAPEE